MEPDQSGKSLPVNTSVQLDDEAHRQAWSYRSGVIVASPTQVPTEPSRWDFDLSSLENTNVKHLPGFQVSSDRGVSMNHKDVHSVPGLCINDCPCGPDCNQPCCKVHKRSSAPVNIRSRQDSDDTPLLSPVEGSENQRSDSPPSFYGSTDSLDRLLTDNGPSLVSCVGIGVSF